MNPAPIEIRPGDASDAEFASRILQRTQAAHVAAYPHRYRPIDLRTAKDEWLRAVDGSADVLVATSAGERLGYAILEIHEVEASALLLARRFGYLRDIGVAPAARRRGVARALVDRVRRLAAHHGLDQVELNVWAFNRGARRSFEAVGFEASGTRMRATPVA